MPIDGCPPNAAHNGKKVEAFAGEFCAATYIGGRDSGYHGDEVPPSRSALREWVHLTRVLFIGQIPETVDFADPAIPAGFNAEKIHAGIAIGMEKLKERVHSTHVQRTRPKPQLAGHDPIDRRSGAGVELLDGDGDAGRIHALIPHLLP